MLPILIIIVWLITDLTRNPCRWVSGFKNKLGTCAGWHFDPLRIDSSKGKSSEDLETENKEDVETPVV